ncbi:MAG: hypothetical protein HYS98_03140, partial [Deltaproteobacteria bacterium]|nr:hypothetical protein [Deltaproteobacteria bacterium]
EGEKFDLIISNPPYCTTDNIDTFRAEVLEYEPTISLNGGLEGIDFHKLILEKAPLYLNPGGVILMEMAPGQEKLLLNICQRNTHYKNIEVIPDYSGRNRIFKVIYG